MSRRFRVKAKAIRLPNGWWRVQWPDGTEMKVRRPQAGPSDDLWNLFLRPYRPEPQECGEIIPRVRGVYGPWCRNVGFCRHHSGDK